MKYILFVAAFCSSAVALAADGQPVQSTFELIMAGVAALVVPMVVNLVRLWQKDKADRYLAFAGNAIALAYHSTTEAVARGLVPKTGTDKVIYGLKVLEQAFADAGLVMKPETASQAKLTWTAMSGAEKTTVALAAKAEALRLDPTLPLASK